MQPYSNPAITAILTAVFKRANQMPRFFLVITPILINYRIIRIIRRRVCLPFIVRPSPQQHPQCKRVGSFKCDLETELVSRVSIVATLCRRKHQECRYPQRRGQKAASPIDEALSHEDVAIRNSSDTIDHRAFQLERVQDLVNAEAIRFLAPDLFRDMNLQVPRLDWEMPAEIEAQLGGRQQMQETTKEFLLLTRSWMPIVNGKRHLAAVLNPLVPLRRPTALLALCMKLCCLSVDKVEEKRLLYGLVKKFYAEVESQEDSCVQVMQSAVFIAVFEMGDAIFPAAYLTVGALLRYGMAMGMDKINQHALGKNCGAATGASWADIEEMRRAWWGALILDRLLNVSQPSRGLSTADPSFEDFLPVDDEIFYNQHYWRQPGHESEQDSTPNIFPETISALETLVRISATLREGGYELWQHLEDGRCSLFLVELVYQGMLVLLRMGKVWLAEEVQSKKESLAWLLSHMGKRWPLVAVYKRILEARESILAVQDALT
ncbi:Zn(II)Cys6 transcriptional activator [Fusarium circinatum]|uniref:Zn(II)Cys6 transcriptional activator n=1 Tax=Fusarium circinatum TaxID=48490 RepID=A0A8H5UAG5_FUSCI|nr:Zn(II)Cys6 transcriptional activator [Fusarium circinatum]